MSSWRPTAANWQSEVPKQAIRLFVAQFAASKKRSQAKHTRIRDEPHGDVTKTCNFLASQQKNSHVAPRSISLAGTWQYIKIATHCIKIATH